MTLNVFTGFDGWSCSCRRHRRRDRIYSSSGVLILPYLMIVVQCFEVRRDGQDFLNLAILLLVSCRRRKRPFLKRYLVKGDEWQGGGVPTCIGRGGWGDQNPLHQALERRRWWNIPVWLDVQPRAFELPTLRNRMDDDVLLIVTYRCCYCC
jgi:hypothetical protein